MGRVEEKEFRMTPKVNEFISDPTPEQQNLKMGPKYQSQQWQKIADLVHYNEQNKSYKNLQVLKTDTGNIVIQLTEGVAQQSKTRVVFQLNEQELAYLAVKLQKLL